MYGILFLTKVSRSAKTQSPNRMLQIFYFYPSVTASGTPAKRPANSRWTADKEKTARRRALFFLFVMALCMFLVLGMILQYLSANSNASSASAKAHGSVSSSEHWVGTWASAAQAFMPGTLETFHNQTVRLIVHTSLAGPKVRIRLSNSFGDKPLAIGAAHIARRTSNADIDANSDRLLRFNGKSAFVIAAHATVLSDAVELPVPALSDLAISLYLPQETMASTNHLLALQTSYVATGHGDVTGAIAFPLAKSIGTWPFLTGVDVLTSADATSIVVFGDSTVDGDGATTDANHRWPDVLAARLQQHHGKAFGVLNEGIIGNRLLQDSPADTEFGSALGQAGIKRFERDVLNQSGIRYVIVRIGINDISFPGAITPETGTLTVEELIAGYRQLIAQAKQKGLHVIGSTLSPFENATLAEKMYTPQKDQLRQQLNEWIRHSGEFDAFIDFDKLLRDPAHPAGLLQEFDSGDHLHPNDAGYAAMANAIPLDLFL